MKQLILLCLCLLIWPTTVAADEVTCVESLPKTNNCYKLYRPKSAPRGLVVLLPGFGDTIEFFDQFAFPKMMQDRGYLVAAISMAGYLEWEKDIKTLHAIVSEIVRKQNIPPNSLTIGGFSAGGTGAVRYGEYCVEQRCPDATRAAAVFTVDAPLDFERWWNSNALTLRREAGKDNENEKWSRTIQGILLSIFGGPPGEKRAAYVKAAPLTVTERDGGNARFLKDTPVRAYSEPDVVFTIENWQKDYHCLNATDQAALVLELKLLGNKDAEFIPSTGRGYRAEYIRETGKYRRAERSPHSWMIVDEQNLADWIERKTPAAAGKPR